jgi:hypothetical protein
MADFQKFTATATGTVYTADSDDVIIGCLVSNTGSTTAQVDVSLASTSLVTNLQIPAGGSVELVRGKLVAVSGDVLELTVDSGTVALYLSVLNEAS